jgi:hypothetical protein
MIVPVESGVAVMGDQMNSLKMYSVPFRSVVSDVLLYSSIPNIRAA